MSSQAPRISVILPALNEATYIGLCIDSINRECAAFEHEIILVDNGSTDGTREIARTRGARVLLRPRASIGELRNIGADEATGELILFLDADMELTPQWGAEFPRQVESISNTPLITGSHPTVPSNPTLMEKYWFDEFRKKSTITHLGSAHMLMSKACFKKVGGFDESLESGEDFDFCKRAEAAGIELKNNPELLVIHHGFPKSLRQFVRRESWHGKGDLQSVHNLFTSKVLLLSFIFLTVHLAGLFALLTGRPVALVSSLIGIAAIPVFSSLMKFRHSSLTAIAVNAAIFYFYYVGRVLAVYRVLSRR